MVEKKKCTKCFKEKPLSSFYNRKLKTKDGKNSYCKKCEEAQVIQWRKNNPLKQKQIDRRAHLKRNFGITVEQYEELFEKQNGRCAICGRHQFEFDKNFAVDHCHETREIRGLLCTFCNRYEVGKNRKSDASKLRRIADYLEQGSGLFVPKKERTKKRKPKRKV